MDAPRPTASEFAEALARLGIRPAPADTDAALKAAQALRDQANRVAEDGAAYDDH